MNEIERKQKALKKIEDMKADIADALAKEKKAIAKAKRQAKKLASGHVNAHTPSETFGPLQALLMAAEHYHGFVYQIDVDGKTYIGKKSFGSKHSRWQTYTSSSPEVNTLIKKGHTATYKVIDMAKTSYDLSRLEQRHIAIQWQSLAVKGMLGTSLNYDCGNGHFSRNEWCSLNGHFSQIILWK